MALIEAAGVHVRFGDRVVLESIDLAVPEGEFHGLMGPNGAGKTTFFNVLTGRVKPSRGSIRLDGEDVTGLSSHRIAAKGVARSFQIMTLFDEFTARENVMVGLPGFRARGFDMRHAAAGDRGFAREGIGDARRPSGSPTRATFAPRICPMATAARSKSRSRSAQSPARALPGRADLRARLRRRAAAGGAGRRG